MKKILEFNSPEDDELFQYAVNGHKYNNAINEMWNQVFRPHYKHGYRNEELQKLIENNYGVASELIDKLAEIYHHVLKECEVGNE